VAVADAQDQLVALLLSAVTHTLQLQVPLEPVGDPFHHVGHQGPGQTVEGPVFLVVAGPAHPDVPVLQFHADVGVKLLLQLSLRTFHAHPGALDGHLDTAGHRNGLSANARHGSSSSLPDIAQDFAADALLTGLPVAHHAARGRQHSHAQPAQHPGNLITPGIDPATGLADAANSRNHPLVLRAVLQVYTQHLTSGGILHLAEIANEAFLLEDASDLPLQAGVGNVHRVLL